MKYLYFLVISIVLLSCEVADTRTIVSNKSKYTVVFTIGDDEYTLEKNSSDIEVLNAGTFMYVSGDITKPTHRRVYIEHERYADGDFIEKYTFKNAPKIELFIKNETNKNVLLSSINIFNNDENMPEDKWKEIVPNSLKTGHDGRLYGFMINGAKEIDPFVVKKNTNEKYGFIFPIGTERYDEKANRIITGFVSEPNFLAVDEKGIKRIVEFASIDPFTSLDINNEWKAPTMLVIIR